MKRPLKNEEKKLLLDILKNVPNSESLAKNLEISSVEDMEDGKMGSIKFINESSKIKSKKFGSVLKALETLDLDGVPISISLNLDEDGELFELDVWKVDFSPLKKFPTIG
ncbi:MAG: DUF6984 family protein [Alphaproteobacteria bacterium]